MARRKKSLAAEPENHDRWLVSYADFITLLFAFFVVMYSISSVNEGKYRVLSDSLNAVFQEQTRSLDPIQIGEIARMPKTVAEDLNLSAPISELPGEGTMASGSAVTDASDPTGNEEDTGTGQGESGDVDDRNKDLSDIGLALEGSLQNFIDQDLVSLTRDGDQIEIEIKARMLFGSGSEHLSKEALKALKDVATVLEPIGFNVQVEGHTDNIPISTARFPSNWELSSARAASVVHYLARNGVSPRRMSAVGYAENRPKSSNKTVQGRADNRRVTLVVTKNDGTKNAFESELQQIDEEQEQVEQGIVPWAEGPALE